MGSSLSRYGTLSPTTEQTLPLLLQQTPIPQSNVPAVPRSTDTWGRKKKKAFG